MTDLWNKKLHLRAGDTVVVSDRRGDRSQQLFSWTAETDGRLLIRFHWDNEEPTADRPFEHLPGG